MKKYGPLIFILSLLISSCKGQTQKINGLSFVASREAISLKHVTPVKNVNASYVAIMPFGFVKSLSNPDIIYNTNRQWFGETAKGVEQYIKAFREENVKIMLKPQIWVWRGEFTGYIKMNSEADWNIFQKSYSKFIIEYAALAQKLGIEILCIGTELEAFIENRPDYWFELIREIKSIYKGELTYAANWDEFKRTPFWEELDYIGIDAYFPLSNNKTPTVQECLNGWKEHLKIIKQKQNKLDKPVLFTEFGYRSVDFTGKEPWKSDRQMKDVNLEAQTNATKALFETFWNEEWFAGGFVWKWFHNHSEVGGENNFMYTPQNKPVEEVIRHYYNSQ